MKYILNYLVLFSLLVTACTVIEPSKKLDIENENRIRDLSNKRDFVSPEERSAIDSELGFRKIKRDGLVIPDHLFDFTKDSNTNIEKPKLPDNKEIVLDQELDKQLGRSSNLSPEIKEKIFKQLLEKNLGGQSNVNDLLLKYPPNMPLEPIR